jgi:hypothetical protein
MRDLAVAGLLGLPLAALAAAPPGPPATQNEQGRCVSAGVQNRFRESGTAQALAREIVAACMPDRRSSSATGNFRHKAYFDRRYADERDGAMRMSVLRIERFRRNAAAAAGIPRGQATLTEEVVDRILRMAWHNWPKPVHVSETRLQRPPGKRVVLSGEWERLATRRVAVEADGGGRFATYYADSAGRVTALLINSGPPPECRAFRAGETLAVEAALMAVPAASAAEIEKVRASVRLGWSPPYARYPARIGSYVFLASRAGGSAPGRPGCHDHLSLTLAPAD